MVCLHGQGELSQCGPFADRGEGVNFSRFCADIFFGHFSINGLLQHRIPKYYLNQSHAGYFLLKLMVKKSNGKILVKKIIKKYFEKN